MTPRAASRLDQSLYLHNGVLHEQYEREHVALFLHEVIDYLLILSYNFIYYVNT